MESRTFMEFRIDEQMNIRRLLDMNVRKHLFKIGIDRTKVVPRDPQTDDFHAGDELGTE